MAKQKSIRAVKPQVKNLLLVTELNRKFSILLGRKVYIIGAGLTCSSPDSFEFIIWPRRIKNTFWCGPGSHAQPKEIKMLIHTEQSREDYADFSGTLTKKSLPQKKVFIDVNEPIYNVWVEDKK